MLSRLSISLKKIKSNYTRNWKEKDNFERYGGICFVLLFIIISLFSTGEQLKNLPKYVNVLAILFMAVLYQRVRTSRRALIEKNKEIEQQKLLLEEKHKEITDSIKYAKRIQSALITSEKYMDKEVKRLSK